MPLFHRIVQKHWAATAFDGEGARRFGGRWNLPGSPAVYLAESRALAALEILVHAPREALHLEWVIFSVEVPAEWIDIPPITKLPADWRLQPSSLKAQHFGSAWLRDNRTAVLRVPSVVVPEENAVMLNPRNPMMRDLKLGDPQDFRFDLRLSG